jgi:TonB family protein
MIQLWFGIIFVTFIVQHLSCAVGSVQAAAPSTSATRSPVASMLYLYVERARMARGIAMLAVWVLLQAPSSLAATRQNKAYEELQHKYETALQEIERLRSELAALKWERTAVPAPPTGGAESTPGGDFLQTGNRHFLAQRYMEAIAAYTQAIEMAPREARAYKHRGLAYAKLGDMQQAQQDLSRAIALDPQDAVAYNQRGIASFAADDVQAALKDFTKTIELQPQLAEAYNNRGIIARKLGDYRQAGKDFARAVQLGMELAQQHLQVLRDEARQAQERLHSAGYHPGIADGVPGPQTVTALRQYQKAQGLPVTGLLDEATRQALGLLSETAAAARQSGEGPYFVYQPTPTYPEVARHNGWEGTVTLRLELLADGTVGDVQVGRSSGHDVLDIAAQEAAKTWKHVPATQEGTPVTRWAEMSLTFKLDK